MESLHRRQLALTVMLIFVSLAGFANKAKAQETQELPASLLAACEQANITAADCIVHAESCRCEEDSLSCSLRSVAKYVKHCTTDGVDNDSCKAVAPALPVCAVDKPDVPQPNNPVPAQQPDPELIAEQPEPLEQETEVYVLEDRPQLELFGQEPFPIVEPILHSRGRTIIQIGW